MYRIVYHFLPGWSTTDLYEFFMHDGFAAFLSEFCRKGAMIYKISKRTGVGYR
jgi:hypothetical protein